MPGEDCHVVWDAGADMGERFPCSASFVVTADDRPVPAGMELVPAGSFQIPIEIPAGTELGALGAAMAAGVATGCFSSYEEAVSGMTSIARRGRAAARTRRPWLESGFYWTTRSRFMPSAS